jgi:hypothetical protein
MTRQYKAHARGEKTIATTNERENRISRYAYQISNGIPIDFVDKNDEQSCEIIHKPDTVFVDTAMNRACLAARVAPLPQSFFDGIEDEYRHDLLDMLHSKDVICSDGSVLEQKRYFKGLDKIEQNNEFVV